MRPALASHDALVRGAVEGHRGTVVKLTGDGVYAAFADPVDAITATLEMQLALADPAATHGVALRVRCGLHTGTLEHRDNDYFGSEVNRGARIMSAAHGGQVIVSQAVVDSMASRLPEAVTLRDLGSVRLRDLSRPERVYQVVHPQLRAGFPGAALARSDAEQPAAAGELVRRPRRGAAAGEEGVRDDAPAHVARRRGPRQDAAVAAGRRRCDGRVSGRRVVRRAGAVAGSATRRASGRLGAGRRSKRPAVRCRRRWSSMSTTGSCSSSSTIASIWRSPPPSWRRRCSRRVRRSRCSRRAASRCAFPARRPSRCRRSRFRRRTAR